MLSMLSYVVCNIVNFFPRWSFTGKKSDVNHKESNWSISIIFSTKQIVIKPHFFSRSVFHTSRGMDFNWKNTECHKDSFHCYNQWALKGFTFTLDETEGFDCKDFKRSLGGGGGAGSEYKAPSETAPEIEITALKIHLISIIPPPVTYYEGLGNFVEFPNQG